jgi:hypothetical protein
MKTTVHIFVGDFPTRDAATAYSEEQWPAGGDEEPTWALLDDQPSCEYLDADFIETLHPGDGQQHASYLGTMLSSGDLETIMESISNDATVVLVFAQALGGFEGSFQSTKVLRFLGTFDAEI